MDWEQLKMRLAETLIVIALVIVGWVIVLMLNLDLSSQMILAVLVFVCGFGILLWVEAEDDQKASSKPNLTSKRAD